jgi:DNA-binding response OmpR family regulator
MAEGFDAGMRVLVVEDYRPLADLVAEGLTDQGMAADVAYDGTEAEFKLNVNAYDVVVLDRNLPGIHGDALCRRISGEDKRAMVLMLSGAESPGDRVVGLSLGADDYLTKPFHFPELVLRVRALARRRPWARPPVLRVAGIELDSLRWRVRRHGQPVELSPKEFAVLEALMTAFPAYLSAEDLLERVWDENADPFTKTVTVTIGRLRLKLGEPRVIHTIPRVGYGMVPEDGCDRSHGHRAGITDLPVLPDVLPGFPPACRTA